MKRVLLTVLTFVFAVSTALAQSGVVKGKLVDENDEPLIGASALIAGTTKGAVADLDGNFTITGVPSGSSTLKVSYIGYETKEIDITVNNGETVDLGTIQLSIDAIGLDQVEVIASVAIDRKTPVALATIDQLEIAEAASNQEFPELLKSTPGVYATKAGGGYGDSRINLRGFNSENVAVLINGVPVNDMENGRVYWSNWAGLTDVTRSMQVQRGLGASKVAVPSIGGTINILTNTTDAKKGGSLYFGIGNDNYRKASFTVSTGLTETNWAVSLSAAKITGDGFVDGTEFEGYNYFLNVTKKINDAHMLSLTGFGAPQKHGQRQSRLAIQEWRNAPQDIKYNPDWGILNGEVVHVEDNFYHKPQFSLNHYWTINDRSELSTAVYVSTGTGGGGGSLGFNIGSTPRTAGAYSPLDLDALVDENLQNADGSATNALRASRNDHRWYGLLSTYSLDLNQNLQLLVGADVRYYKGIHFREITNLLGADYYIDDSDVNEPIKAVRVGDKYSYHNDGIVKWLGGFGQLEYTQDQLSAFVSLSASNTGYKRIDYFNYLDSDPLQESDFVNFFGYQAKGGANYNLTQNHNVFANVGYFERAPIFDNVFVNFSNTINEDAENEKILSYELGYGYRSKVLSANVNIYRTERRDRSFVDPIQDEIIANLKGVNAIHQGVEVDFVYQPFPSLKITGMGSFGDWEWQNDLRDVQIFDGQTLIETYDLYISGLKVGDAAQTTANLGVKYNIISDFSIGLNYNYNANIYSSYEPNSRNNSEYAGLQSWKLPDFGLMDLRMKYDFKIGDFDATIYGNINNLFNEEVIKDSNDGADDPNTVDIDETSTSSVAQTWFGQGRTWTAGLRIRF